MYVLEKMTERVALLVQEVERSAHTVMWADLPLDILLEILDMDMLSVADIVSSQRVGGKPLTKC
jgi:hypothetical protein